MGPRNNHSTTHCTALNTAPLSRGTLLPGAFRTVVCHDHPSLCQLLARSFSLSRSRLSLASALNPLLYLPLATSLRVSRRPLARNVFPRDNSHHLPASLYLSTCKPLDLIDRCQPPVQNLCATDCDIVSCNRPTLRRTSPRERTGARTTQHAGSTHRCCPYRAAYMHTMLSQSHYTNCCINCCAICHTTQNTSQYPHICTDSR